MALDKSPRLNEISRLRGYLQDLAHHLAWTAPQRGGGKGEGSVLGALGGFLNGDNS